MFAIKSHLEDSDRRDLDHSGCGEGVGGGCTRSGHLSRSRDHDAMPGLAGDSFGGRSAGGRSAGGRSAERRSAERRNAGGRSNVGRDDRGNNQNHFLYSGSAINPTCAVPERKSIIAEALVSRLAQLHENIATHFCLNPSKTLSVADKSVQSRLSFSPAPSLARKEGQKIFSKEIGRRDLIQAIIGIILSRIKEEPIQ